MSAAGYVPRKRAAALALACVFAAMPAAAGNDVSGAGFACVEAERRCACAGPADSKGCLAMAPHCADPIVCAGATCMCKFWPGFLGGPRRRG